MVVKVLAAAAAAAAGTGTAVLVLLIIKLPCGRRFVTEDLTLVEQAEVWY